MVPRLSCRPHLYSRPARRRGCPGGRPSCPPPGHRHRPVRDGRVGARPSVGLPGRMLRAQRLPRRSRHSPRPRLPRAPAPLLSRPIFGSQISSKGSDSTPMSSCSPCGYLTSPRSPFGYASVGKELRRLRSLGWYEFYSGLPFWPMYLNGQGATGAQVGAGTGSGAPPRATGRAPPPSTPPASRPSPSMRPPTSTICRSTSYATGATSFESGSVLGVYRRWGEVGRWGRYVCGRGRHCACRRQRRGVHLRARSPVGTAGEAGTLRRAALGVGRGVPGARPQAEGGWGLAAAARAAAA